MATPAAADPTPTTGSGAAGGMRALTLATLFAAASGYLVMVVAGRTLGPVDYPLFATYWGAFFALGGVANGLMQEATRAVRSARVGAMPTPRTGNPVRLLPAGLMLGLVLAAVVVLSAPAWPTLGLPTFSGAGVAIMAFGILGFTLQAATAGALSGTERWSLYAALLTVDAALRLLVAGVAWWLGDAGLGFALATVAGTLTWALMIALSPAARAALASALDAGRGRFWRNTGAAMLASAGTSVLVTGFPLFVTATVRASDPAPLVGAVILAITLTRAPLLVPLTSFQSAIIVYFVQRRASGPRALVAPLGLVTAIGIVGAGAAWLVGPWLIRVLFGAEFELPGAVLAALTAASVGTAALMVTGNAALAFDRHLLYNAGWWVAVLAALILLVAIPGPLDVRSAIALLAGPGIGVVVHVAGLVVATRRAPAAAPRHAA
ncbi:polysaccharide biosynthesis protein [Rhodococcus sp. IEGM 1408]|uniref:polysaccharide biosynthesis protein n=1 Tax=Rhodococcus sp. IEGM 1408 TaxID=3082220 RepID=UPI002952E765|nr:polysaccharide biosynthesis protein [Rhodococcus sp. IEGM 1408]MDV8002293.1 polysaccharide biosynthesis protein [Rhodococcus sp. IEGM 1408]